MTTPNRYDELAYVWRQLSRTYAQAAGCTNRAEAKRLVALHEYLRGEYRHLSSILYNTGN